MTSPQSGAISAVSRVDNNQRKPCEVPKNGKFMAFIFWYSHGIITIDYLKKG